MAGPYGAPAYKIPPGKQNKSLAENKLNDAGYNSMSTMNISEEEMNDTEWPLDRTLTLPKSYTTMNQRPSIKGDEILKTDPSSLTKQSITMIYTPKPMVIKSPPPPVEKMPPVDEKKLGTPATKVPSPTPTPKDPTPSPPPPPSPPKKQYSMLKRTRPYPNPKSEFDHLLECPKCRQRVLEPKIACCRRLCQECLQLDIEETCSREGVMNCPVCGKTVTVPDTKQPKRLWARQFETDTFLSHLREAVIQLEGKRLCYVCQSRNAIVEANNYCFDCDTYFCTQCTEAHRHMPNQKNHRVRPLTELKATDLMKLKKRFCRTHEGVPLDLYCQEHKVVMCQQCAATIHQSCGSFSTVANVVVEKKDKLKTADKILKVGLNKCEHNTKRIQTESTEINQMKQQTLNEIDCSFAEVIKALEDRKKKLKRDIDDHFNSEMPQFEETKTMYENLTKSMKSKTDFLKQLMEHASDFDILACADNLYTSAENMASQNKDIIQTPRPKVIVKIDDTAVKNFVELVSLLGAEVGSTQVKGILLKKITTKMKGDQHTPDIRDILMAGEENIIVVDNKNACVKSIIVDGEGFVTRRLQLKSEPWGGTKLQPSMIAVTGLKVIYIITVTDELNVQSTVKTRKDYWGVCAISPINLACSCKYPPGVDIVDITGRRLRSIEQDHLGQQLFEMPGYVAVNGDNILVTDRAKGCLTCVDQEGKVVFIYRGQGEEALKFPRGMCVDRQRRIFLADHDKGCVHLLNSRGEYLCQVMSVPRPRTLCLDNQGKTLYLSNEGKGITFFNLIEVQT